MLGRPKIHKVLILTLDDATLYSAASIARHAEALGLIEGNHQKRYTARRKIRHTLARFIKNHDFPADHGKVKLTGQVETNAWTGLYWKQAYAGQAPKEDQS